MKRSACLFFLLIALGCNSNRLFDEHVDFPKSYWLQNEKPSFEFRIRDTGKKYNLLCTIRNTSTYPYARLFLNYSLKDSTGAVLSTNLQTLFLFDAKNGKPFGSTGIGDVFDHNIPILSDYTFNYTGRFTVEFEQYMRLDTLQGINSVGFKLLQAEETAK